MMMLPLLLLSLAAGPERPQSPSTAELQIGAVSVTGVSRYTPSEVVRLSAEMSVVGSKRHRKDG